MQVRKQGGKIELDLKASNPIVKCDKTHITSVIFNLIDNALKYSEENPRIKISSVQTDDGIELSVRDNGVGIPQEHLGKVFERLYRSYWERSRCEGVWARPKLCKSSSRKTQRRNHS